METSSFVDIEIELPLFLIVKRTQTKENFLSMKNFYHGTLKIEKRNKSI